MITSVRMVNFKNFADETLKVGPFTVIVGANASGKSNIRDAFRFLHGIGRGYTLAEILGGKYGPGGQMEWAGIRGAPSAVVRLPRIGSHTSQKFSVHTELDLVGTKAYYSIQVEFDPIAGFVLSGEGLKTESSTCFVTRRTGSGNLEILIGENGEERTTVSHLRPSLGLVGDPLVALKVSSSELEGKMKDLIDNQSQYALARMRFLDPSPERMREPSIPGATMMGDSGESLPSVLEAICADSTRERTLMSWLQELTPMEVKGFEFPRDPSGRVHLQIVERNGRKVSAYSASDGTLRFLGILAALLGPDPGGIYFFEEIDNGIHPSRLWLLLDFIQRQTAGGGVQVITTTHSPALLAWMNDSTFEHTSVVYRDEYWADSVIRPIADLYNLRELRKSQGLERLLTNGWFEHAMKASEGDPDTDHLDDDEDDWEQGVLE